MQGHLVFGSNLGDRAAQIDAALTALPVHGVAVHAVSSRYETAPVGPVAGQPPYLNGACAIETDLDPEALLDALKAIEADLGRPAPGTPGYVDQGPRPIDLDIALLGPLTVTTERLTVPHPALLERRFALIPLLELDFALALPDGRRLSDALAVLPIEGQDVRRAG